MAQNQNEFLPGLYCSVHEKKKAQGNDINVLKLKTRAQSLPFPKYSQGPWKSIQIKTSKRGKE